MKEKVSKSIEKSIDELAKEYNAELLKGIELLHKVIHEFIDHKLDKSKLDGVIQAEKKCDRIKDKYIRVLFQDKRALPFLVEDRYKIITLVDQALGKVEFFARFLKVYPFDFYDEIANDFSIICDICSSLMKDLVETLELMETDFDSAYEKTFQIEATRREARTIKFELLEILFKKNDNPIKIYLTSKIITYLYNIISHVEDISDYLRGLIIKYPSR
jgi:predicted phosphate transport protein (TIGR00153 family)